MKANGVLGKWLLSGVLLLGVVVLCGAGLIDKDDQHMNGNWTFWNSVTFKGGTAIVPKPGSAASFTLTGAEGQDSRLVLDADEGDDAADTWTIESEATGNDLSVMNDATEVLNLTSAGALSIDSTLAVSAGDDTYSVPADDTHRFSSNDNNTTVQVYGFEAKDAILLLSADESDDNGDDWQIESDEATNSLIISNDTSGAQAAKLTLATTGNATLAGDLTVSGGDIDAGASGAAGTLDVFPSTAARGKLTVQCADNTTDHSVILTNAPANGANATVTLPALTGYAAISTASLTLAEVDVLDAVAAGTASASKAAILGANKNLDTLVIADGGLYLGAGAGTSVTATAAELNYCDVTTAGTVQASKAVVVSADKDAGDFRNLDCVNLDAGSSGAAGTVDVFPSTASRGKIALQCADNAADHTVTLTNASHGQATTYTVPDIGQATGNVVLLKAAQTTAGELKRADMTAETDLFVVQLTDLVQDAARKDDLPDGPSGTVLGLGDAEAAVVTATAANGNSQSETCAFQVALPENYVAAGAVTVVLRAKISALPTVANSNTVDLVAKELADGAVGADICATAASVTTAAYADYSFSITPAGLVAGDVLSCQVTLAANDTAGAQNAVHTISKVSISYSGK